MSNFGGVQSPFQKVNFANSNQKGHKTRHQSLLVLSNFTGELKGKSFVLSHDCALWIDTLSKT